MGVGEGVGVLDGLGVALGVMVDEVVGRLMADCAQPERNMTSINPMLICLKFIGDIIKQAKLPVN
jgi:hypothetical protein